MTRAQVTAVAAARVARIESEDEAEGILRDLMVGDYWFNGRRASQALGDELEEQIKKLYPQARRWFGHY